MIRFLIAVCVVGWSWQTTTAQNDSLQTAANQTAANRLVDVIANDLNELIPGDYEPESDSANRLIEIANAYVSRNEQKVKQLLDELAAAEPTAPPRELLLAGMAYATNNPNNGRIQLERGAIRFKKHPGFPLIFARLALLQNRFYDAVSLAEKARTINQDSGLSDEIRKFYDVGSVALLTVVEMRRNELSVAEDYARQWASLAPSDDKMLLASAEIKFKQDRIESATEFLEQRNAQKKTDFPTEVIIGKWYQSDGKTGLQATWITQGFEKYPNNKLAQIEYAVVLLRSEKFEQALDVVKTYEAANGATPDSELIKGRIAFSREDYKTSYELFSKLSKLQPNNFEHAYLNILAMLENPDAQIKQQAVPLAQRAYQLFPNNSLAVALLGWALVKTDNVQQGGEIIKRALDMGGMLPDPGYFLAVVMHQDGRTAQASQILEQIVTTPEIFLFRSRAKGLLESITLKNSLPNPNDKK